MAETNYENIKKLSELLNGEIKELQNDAKKVTDNVKRIKLSIDEKNKVLLAKKAEMKEVAEEPTVSVEPEVSEKVVVEPVKVESEEVVEKPKKKSSAKKKEVPVEQPAAEEVQPVEVKVAPVTETEEKDEKPKKEKKKSVEENIVAAETKEVEPVKEETTEKPEKTEKVEKVEKVEKTEKSEKSEKSEKPAVEEKKKPVYDTSSWLRKADKVEEKPRSVRKEVYVPAGQTQRPAKKEYVADRERNQKGSSNNRSQSQQRQFVSKAAPIMPPVTNGKATQKKKTNERSFEDKKQQLNKRALIKKELTVDDFDENKTGYRKMRPAKKQKAAQATQTVKIEKAVITTEMIPLKVLSEKIGVSAIEITKKLFKEGIMKTINDSIDFDTAAYIAADLGIELELKLEKTAEDILTEGFDDVENEENLVKRPPVVTVMGHVDHGKTSLLDKIRKASVAAGEAGGITQHIGAYQVSINGKPITFLDTPGHAAFTAMRARGAQATDIAVLVVAADDGIMPQTIEAINHAKAAGVSIIVAMNKMDKPEANPDRVKTQLTEQGLVPEEWGGDVMLCPVSAKTGEGIDGLLESITLLADLKELKANPDRKAKGVVIEAKLDQSKGPVANILIQTGTLKIGDPVIIGTVTGKIRAMLDDKGRRITSAGPSVPVSIMGLDDVPSAGDIMYAVSQELTKKVAEERKIKEQEARITAQKVSLDDVFNRIAEGAMKNLNIIVKADVQGSVEAVKQSLEKLSNDEVKVNVIHAAAGAISETDIMLADSSNAIIIGFNVRPDSNAKNSAEKSGVDIKLYRVIYEAIEDVEKALKGMLAPKYNEIYMGKAEVRETFKITGVGMVAGCYVTEGKIIRNGKLRIYRDDVMICEGNVLQLKRFKDDVKEVQQGFECGISIEKFNDIKIGDFIESYLIEEVKA